MERRHGEDSSWVSSQVGDSVTELSAHQPMSWEVPGLDDKFEHVFYVSASWVDVPALLRSSEWSPELASPILHSRPPPELSVHGAPSAEVATEHEGLVVQLRWQYLASDGRQHVRNSKESMVTCYQLQFLCMCEDQEEWCLEPPTMLQEEAETAFFLAPWTIISRIRGLRAGATYCFRARIGDGKRLWSQWSYPSEAVQLSVGAPAPQPGDVLGTILEPPLGDVDGSGEGGCSGGGGNKLSYAARLHWRPFRSPSGLCRIEYRIMMLEWSAHEQGLAAEPAPEHSLLARLRRADKRGRGTGQWPAGDHRLRIVGYVSSDDSSSLEWRADQLRPGACYRFFVTARYSNLPAEALASPHGWHQDLTTLMRSTRQTDDPQDQSPLSRMGLWSTMLEII